MNSITKKIFIILVALQISALGFMIVKRVMLIKYGKTVLLKCEPIDPRSLFSGDYVILNYEISHFSNYEFENLNLKKEKFNNHETIYIGLKKKEKKKYWHGVEISHNYDYLNSKYKIVLRGELSLDYSRHTIKYGVESYFVPQFKGQEIEKNLGDTYVEIAVSNSGESAIKKLFINNIETKFN